MRAAVFRCLKNFYDQFGSPHDDSIPVSTADLSYDLIAGINCRESLVRFVSRCPAGRK